MKKREVREERIKERKNKCTYKEMRLKRKRIKEENKRKGKWAKNHIHFHLVL